jgi:hypothetical protein
MLRLWLVLQWRQHLRRLRGTLQHPEGLPAAVWLLHRQRPQPQPLPQAPQPITKVSSSSLPAAESSTHS